MSGNRLHAFSAILTGQIFSQRLRDSNSRTAYDLALDGDTSEEVNPKDP